MKQIPFILVNYNMSQDLISCIDSIKRHVDDFFLIIIDNDSNNINKEIVKKYLSNMKCFEMKYTKDILHNINPKEIINQNINVLYILMNNNHGFSYANNLGSKIAIQMNFKYAIIANPDTLLRDGKTIEKMLNIINMNKKIAVVFPKVIGPDNKMQGPFYKHNFYMYFFYRLFWPILCVPTKIFYLLKRSIECLFYRYYYVYTSIGCFFMIDLNCFNEIHGFDEDFFMYFEEQILGNKIEFIKKKCVYVPDCLIYHSHDYNIDKINKSRMYKSKEKFLKKYMNFGKNRLKLIQFAEFIYSKSFFKIESFIKRVLRLKEI